ncbi:MAG: ATP-binding protein [Spirochaetes bacterium]|nr:ATP-binding protein [Spirochaetota bacterium]
MNNSVYSIIKSEDITETLIPTLIFFYKSLNRKELAKEVIRFIKNVKLEYIIPNSLKYISLLTDHLVRDLSVIGLISPKKSGEIKIGLQEIIINAIEHGNLEISFSEKSRMLEKGINIDEIIEKYSVDEKFKDRKVTIKYSLSNKKAVYMIKDEGSGFDWKEHLNTLNHEKNVLLEHGRGIFLALKYFDRVYYNKKGNEVVLEIHKH